MGAVIVELPVSHASIDRWGLLAYAAYVATHCVVTERGTTDMRLFVGTARTRRRAQRLCEGYPR